VSAPVVPAHLRERHVVVVDQNFVPPVVVNRVAEVRAHPHGGPPGQIKKQLGLQTGAEVVHGGGKDKGHKQKVVVVQQPQPAPVVVVQQPMTSAAPAPVVVGAPGKGHGHGNGNAQGKEHGNGHGKGKGKD